MNLLTQTAAIATVASVNQTLPEPAAQVISVVGLAGAATAISATAYSVQSGAPASASEVQFTGTANAPSTQLTFDAALTASGLLLVTYVPVGGMPASQ